MIRTAYFLLCLVVIIAFFRGLTNQQQALEMQSLLTEQALAKPSDSTDSTDFTDSATQIYLPLVSQSDTFWQNPAIWSHDQDPAAHEIVLFRHDFSLDENLKTSYLKIMADTRYEVWLDGEWIGRGPARFSPQTREYDHYDLGELSSGSHLIAVLVQWAPNARRSESETPFLQASLSGITTESVQPVIIQSSSEWQALSTRAWKLNTPLVHQWHLIGPTELLDLRQLPPDWMQPSFSANQWPDAVLKKIPSATKQPRSIPPLSQVPIPVTVRDRGVLAPNKMIVELTPSATEPVTHSFNAEEETELVLETLKIPDTELATVLLDGVPLQWSSIQMTERHPNIRVAKQLIAPGDHLLSVSGIPADGFTLSLSKQKIDSPTLAFQQGLHAGRRLLLAESISQRTAVTVSGEDTLNLEFEETPAYVVLDLGRVVHGRVLVDVTGPTGSVIDMGWDERLWQGKYPLPYPGSFHKQWNQTDSWILSDSTRSISTIDSRAGRYILIAVWADGPVHLNNLRVEEERYPVMLKGSFLSTSTRLNKIWKIGVDTLYSNMTDAYTDTPWRERGQWWGDAYVAQQINYVAFGDTALQRRGLVLMADGVQAPFPPPLAPHGGDSRMLDFGMLWVESLYDYQRLSPDHNLLVQLYPSLTDFLDYLVQLEHPTTGLLDIPVGHWSQTSLIDWAGHDSRYGQSTALNAMYYGTLLDAAALAEQIGDSSQAERWREKAKTIQYALQTHLYLPNEGRYVSTLVEDQIYPPSPQAQAWPLAYGIVPEDQEQQVADALLQLLGSNPASPKVEIYGMFWVLKALGRTGRITDGLNLIEQYYGRLLDLGATTWWESFNSHLLHTSSLSHAWGGSPTWFLSQYILGARWLGGNRWQLQPVWSGLPVVSGTLPLQNGMLVLQHHTTACKKNKIELTSPQNSEGEVIIPFTYPETQLSLNGTIIWQNGVSLSDEISLQADGLHVMLGGGQHTIEIDQQLECSALYLPLFFNKR